jgi:secondary thiamine-phosphate synthase enzyme
MLRAQEDRPMETFAPVSTSRHTRIEIDTDRPTQFIDITDQIEAFVAASGVPYGIVNIQSLHTTTAIVLNEHEPLLLSDFSTMLARTVPRAFFYRHDDLESRTVNVLPGERANGHSHCRALLLGASAALNVADGRLQRGRWQRIFLVELDGPRTREISVLLIGESVNQ